MKFSLLSFTLFALAIFLFFPSGNAQAAAPTGFTYTDYEDTNGDGAIDHLLLIINGGEPLTRCHVDDLNVMRDWTYVGNGLGGALSTTGLGLHTCDSATATIKLAIRDANPGVTGTNNPPTIAYNNNDGTNSIANSSGELGNTAAVTPFDAAAPRPSGASTADQDSDGFIDAITIMATESVSDNSTTPSEWSVQGYTVTGVVTGAVANDATISLTLSEHSTPDTDISPTVSYTAGNLRDLFSNRLASTSFIASDTAAPIIASRSPASSATNLAVNAPITITFSEDMNRSTVESAFSLLPAAGNLTFSWSGYRTMTAHHSVNFQEGVQYTISLSNAAASLSSNDPNLAATSWSFTTSSPAPLTVTLFSPNGGETLTQDSVVNITWTTTARPIIPETQDLIQIILSSDGGNSFPTTLTSNQTNNGLYAWRVPATSGSSFRLKIIWLTDGVITATDISDGNFSIQTSGAGDGVTSGNFYDPALASNRSPTINDDQGLKPTQGLASLCVSNTLIKSPSFAVVYYCGADGQRYVFPNDKVYFTWYTNFSGVIIVSEQTLAAIPLGGVVTYRPGIKMIKIESDPKTYAVATNGLLRWVISEALATKYYGTNWNKKIDDIPVGFWVQYRFGPDITQ
ncbi:Ig-like domain-containing protein [Candidatus Uhrbacteria bacterium]|nr:Ig-like domain-containing protein [Candidatus Uhrbacteria bacterium]